MHKFFELENQGQCLQLELANSVSILQREIITLKMSLMKHLYSSTKARSTTY